MKTLEVEDSEQVHAAFLVYMDLKEGEFDICEHVIDVDTVMETGIWATIVKYLTQTCFCVSFSASVDRRVLC